MEVYHSLDPVSLFLLPCIQEPVFPNLVRLKRDRYIRFAEKVFWRGSSSQKSQVTSSLST